MYVFKYVGNYKKYEILPLIDSDLNSHFWEGL